MKEKVILILADGMRPDSLGLCKNKYVDEFMSASTYDLAAQTVWPSVTLPCHMSLFYGVEPSRHGVLTNTYTPQVRPIASLVDVLNLMKKKCGFFYDWGQLRDLCSPGSLSCSYFLRGDDAVASMLKLKEYCIDHINKDDLDFIFYYIGLPDHLGHDKGFMSSEYIDSIRLAWDCIKEVTEAAGDKYTVIVTADHGGHDRSHGHDIPEDMTIPILLKGRCFEKGKQQNGMKLIDLTPTVCTLLGIEPDSDWEGKNLLYPLSEEN